MAAALETLRDCCRTVAGDRLRDRRESADQLRQLIADNATLCAELDDAGRDRDRLNWTYVWEHVVIHFQKEMDKAEEDARRGKNVTQRELVPRQAVSLLRAVAHRANRGRARLEATQLAGTLLAALRHPFRRAAAGPELCAMLSAALLEPALVRAELSLVGWRDLLSGVISLLAEPPHRLQTHTLRSLLSLTAELGCQQTALLARVRGLLPLLDADGLLRDAPPITLRLVNVVLRLTAASGRRAVCRVGERLFTSVCQLADARHQCQEQVLAFLRLQVCARAPLCLRTAPAEETWARQLRKMYQVVVDEVESRCLRSRMVGRAAPLTTPLSDDWVRLFADVAYLLFERDEDTVLDVTLLPSLSTDGRPAKRRRLEVGVRAVCERIYETRASTECVPWLQLLTALIGAHPDALSAAQLPPCLSLLVSLLAAGSRLPEVVCHQLRLAVALLDCAAAQRVPDRQADDVTAAWARIWELAVQASSLVQRQDASHALLQALLRRRAARPGRSFLALYLQREAVPAAVTPPLVVTLLEYLRRFAVPQPPGPAADPTETRCRLAQWLLESGCEPRASAEALVRLALRDNAADLGSLVEWCSNETAAGTDWYTDLGELYVCSELEKPLRVADSPPTPPAAPPTDVGEASVAPLKTKILSELTALVTAAERRNDDPSAGDAAVPRWCRAACDTAVLAASTLRFAGDCGLLSADELRHSPLVASLRSLVTTLLRTAAGEQLSAPPTADLNAHLTLLSLLTGLRALFETAEAPPVGSPHQAAAGRRALGSLLRSATPRVFTQEALRLLRDEASRLLPQSRRVSHSDPLSDSSGESPLDSEFSEAECISTQEPGRDSVLDIALHELEEVRLEACRLLVSFANVDAGEDVIAGSEAPEELLSDVFMALLENRLDVRYPGDMRIALDLLRKLPSSSALCTTHVVSLSELLQAVCRAWPRDVAVNLAVLDAMAGGYVQAVARRGCDKDRADAMKFVTVMVRKAETARFGERCLLSLLRLLAALAEQDPCGRWAVVDGRWAARPLLTHLSAPAEPNERGAGAWSTHRSRLLATRLLESVFAARERQPAVEGAAPSVQEMFELIYPSVIESMAQTAEQAVEWTRPDDAPNRAATLCLALCRVALGSSQCRPQALLALCQAPRRLLEAHLDFIVSQWLAERLTVLEFPHQLLEFASAKEFVREELGCVVPHLLGRHQDQLAAVAQLLEQQPAELVLSCVPQIVAQVVPGLAGSDGAALTTAQRLYSRARQLVGGSETFDRALAAQTVEVLAALFRAHGAKPECIVPALQFAADKMYGSSLVVSLRRPAEDGLQRLLLLLATDVSAAAGSADRLAATRRYCALLDLLADDFAHLEELRPFVMLDVPSFVSHQLAALRLPAEAAAAERWATALGRLARACAEQAPDALAPALELLCSALVGLHEACAGDECAPARDSAAGTLRLLLGPLSDGYRAAAEALTCLPVDGPLGGLTLAPAGGVLRTLSVGGALNVHALRAALEQVETPGSAAAADCSDALLARLLRLAAGEGGELRRAAARLLGAVGPRRLEGATLRVSPPAWQRTDAVGEEELRDVHLLERLHQLLTDRDVSVVSAAGTALRAVLASPAATRWQELLAVERPSFASELLPFYMTRQPLTPERLLTASEALRRLDSATLWVPEHGQYELWLTDVTLALLEAGARSTPSLTALAPLCSVKGADTRMTRRCSPGPADGDELRSLLCEAHVQLGDADGVAALRTGGGDSLTQAVYLEQEGLSSPACLPYRDGDVAAAAEAVERGRTAALAVLAGSATPSTHVAGLCLSRLRLLWRADQLCQVAGGSPAELSALCDRWRHAPAPRLPFRLEEPQLSFSASLLAVLAERQPTLQDALLLRQETLLRLSEGARAAGRLAAAERAAAALPADSVPSIRCRAENSWARSDAESALWLCRGLLDEGTREQQPAGRRLQLAQLKVLYAGWLSEVHREGPQEILEQHLEPAIVQLEQMTDGPDSERALLEAHYLAGQYADAQFQRVDEWHFNLTRSAELDEAELRQAEDDRTAFQRRAVASYLRCLQLGRHRDLLVYRLVALWLADTSGQVCELLRPAAPRLPAFKLVPLLYQLAARLGRPGWLPESAQLLEELLERCAAEHPHHTLPVLLALKNAHADAAGGAAPATDAGGEARTAAATRLVKRLANKPALAEPVRQLEAASAALVELAYHTHVGTASSGRVPSGCRLLKLGELSAVAVQTVPLPVRADADYTAVPTVIKWDNKYDMVGGVNAPKKLRCLGSDGRWRPQLLKGRDDLRQDAVMQQVFSRSGLIEWCVDTQPLADYLADKRGGAHVRYRPDDMTPAEARRAMQTVAKKSADQKRRAVCRGVPSSEAGDAALLL
ncbi:Serine-protein kinase ATM [Amphibalanus amphitrite]|uniref:Serine-protein kinase ATM n=1 Tax=Amphibalanus amphitrite TaxID=1232801 RepID=A0A6A4VZU6_AMPAM|nr:Serine-protein kinase ATM [Amphibalanus amphitrite]